MYLFLLFNSYRSFKIQVKLYFFSGQCLPTIPILSEFSVLCNFIEIIKYSLKNKILWPTNIYQLPF